MTRSFLFVVLIVSVCTHAKSQNDKVLDSLKLEISLANNDSSRSVAMARLGYYLHDLDVDSAFYYSSKSLKLAKSLDYQMGIGESYYALSHYYWVTGLYREALDLALKSLSIFESTTSTNIKGIADNFLLIGNIYSYLPDYDLAKQYYKKSHSLALQLTDVGLKTRCLNNLGYVYMKLEKYDSASLFLNESLKINKQNFNIRGEAYNLSNLGEISAKEQKFDIAISLLEESSYNAAKVDEIRLQARNYGELSRIYRALGKTDLAQSFATKSFFAADQINAAFEKKEAARQLYLIMESFGRSGAALKYYKIYMQIEDSLLRKRLTAETQLLVNNYQLLKTEAELKLIQSENDLSKAQLLIDSQRIKNQRKVILLSSCLLAIFLLLIFLTYRRYKSNLNYSKSLALINEKIGLQNEEIHIKSEELKALNEQLSEMNDQLECKVKERTQELLDRNLQLEDYAFINSHKLRRPLASILGLIYLFERQLISSEEFTDTLLKLKEASVELDQVIAEINEVLNRS